MKLKLKFQKEIAIRNSFVASPGYYWASVDYSTMEYRVMANLANEQNIIQALQGGADFHIATASTMLDKPIDKVTKDDRQIGKRLNFGLVYGLTDNGLANNLGVSVDEAKALRAKYFKNLPAAGAFINAVKDAVIQTGQVRTMSGRIRHFEDKIQQARNSGNNYGVEQASKQGFNTLCQGGAADLAKLAMWRVFEMIKPYGNKIIPLLQIHDAIDFEIHESVSKEEFWQLADAAMSYRNIVPGWADIPVDVEFGTNFGDVKKAAKFGLDIEALKKDNPFLEKVPDCSWFFDPIINGETLLYSAKGIKAPTHSSSKPRQQQTKVESEVPKKTFGTRETLKSSTPKVESKQITAPVEISAGKRMYQKMSEQKEATPTARIDLTNAKFNISTVVIHKKEEVDDDTAYNLLKKFVAENFGQNDLVIEDSQMLYRFPENYRISDNTAMLEPAFDVQVFKAKPKISLSL